MYNRPELLKKPLVFKLPPDIEQSLQASGDVKLETFGEGAEDHANDSPDSSDDDDGPSSKAAYITKEIANSPSGPIFWLTSPLLPSVWLGMYKTIYPTFSRLRQAKDTPRSGSFFFCMTGGGHFAAAIVSLDGKVLQHKTFHRYTTRRKQGGAQGSSDAASGMAHSAGSSLRRHNEAALTLEVRQLLGSWKTQIDEASILFVRATRGSNRKMLFGPYDGQILDPKDPRLSRMPFSTYRATLPEITRCFNELTTLKVSHEDPIPAPIPIPEESAPKAAHPRPASPQLSDKEQAAVLHTSQLTSLIRRSKASALLAYLSSNKLTSSFSFFPPSSHHHAPSLLYLAASLNSPASVTTLLVRANADPTLRNEDGKSAFELAGDKPTRDAFRVARFDLGDEKWDWDAAGVPAGISRTDIDAKAKGEKKREEEAESTRRKLETARLTEASSGPITQNKIEPSARDRREAEARGLTPEGRMRLERERRARAAEARMKAASSNS
ncbi:MAG: hypothetical protein M1814_000196 [Vezdaea aestivalis]|nr:MAG: hypothetical protein M1814_000196 [Vezdaea aestivalis]